MKRLIVCCDGTWNTPDQPHPTNVDKINVMLTQTGANGIRQAAKYLPGVGTGKMDKLVGGMFGVGLSKKVREAYRFLMSEYEPGDELYFFGFSRGAFTARSTVGFIRNSGLLKREHIGMLDAAYDLYKRRDDDSHPAEKEAVEFRAKYSHEPRIKFIGVWDTVGSLGIPLSGPFAIVNFGLRFHDAGLSSWVDNAYHAVSIDERRRPFKPTLWTQDPKNKHLQVLEQVWFAGVHSNVGGGYKDAGLSDVALRWMITRAAACGLDFDPQRVAELLKPNEYGELVNSLKWYYKIVGLLSGGIDLIRKIGEHQDGRESAADAAVSRLQSAEVNPRYDPENLIRFLDMRGPITPVGPAKPTPAPAASPMVGTPN